MDKIIKKGLYYWCKTEEDAIDFLSNSKAQGYKWVDGEEIDIKNTYWEKHDMATLYRIVDNGIGFNRIDFPFDDDIIVDCKTQKTIWLNKEEKNIINELKKICSTKDKRQTVLDFLDAFFTPKKTITIYDRKNNPKVIKLPDKGIKELCVCVKSKDETGFVVFEDDTKLYFDAGNEKETRDFCAEYTIPANEIDEWDSCRSNTKLETSIKRIRSFYHKIYYCFCFEKEEFEVGKTYMNLDYPFKVFDIPENYIDFDNPDWTTRVLIVEPKYFMRLNDDDVELIGRTGDRYERAAEIKVLGNFLLTKIR